MNSMGRNPLSSVGVAVMFAVHLWTVILAFQVNGFGISGWIIAVMSLSLFLVAELGWGIWALLNGHVYLWGAIGFFVALVVVGSSSKSSAE